MPLVVEKARRPSWQDVIPAESELRGDQASAGKHQAAFSRAFLRTVRNLYAQEGVIAGIKRALNDGDVEGAINSVPWFNPGDPESVKFWSKLSDSLVTAYSSTLEEAGQRATRRLKIDMTFKITKQVPVVPVNPFSLRWISEQAALRVVGINETEKSRLRQIIFRGVEKGDRTNDMINQIERTIGLTVRDEAAVSNRLLLQLLTGVPEVKAASNAKKYADQLLTRRAKNIARTETLEAMNQGLHDSWQLAGEQGLIPQNTQRQWVAMSESERTCPICGDLDGKTAGMNEPFSSAVIGAVQRPPAHPSCRCTVILEF